MESESFANTDLSVIFWLVYKFWIKFAFQTFVNVLTRLLFLGTYNS